MPVEFEPSMTIECSKSHPTGMFEANLRVEWCADLRNAVICPFSLRPLTVECSLLLCTICNVANCEQTFDVLCDLLSPPCDVPPIVEIPLDLSPPPSPVRIVDMSEFNDECKEFWEASRGRAAARGRGRGRGKRGRSTVRSSKRGRPRTHPQDAGPKRPRGRPKGSTKKAPQEPKEKRKRGRPKGSGYLQQRALGKQRKEEEMQRKAEEVTEDEEVRKEHEKVEQERQRKEEEEQRKEAQKRKEEELRQQHEREQKEREEEEKRKKLEAEAQQLRNQRKQELLRQRAYEDEKSQRIAARNVRIAKHQVQMKAQREERERQMLHGTPAFMVLCVRCGSALVQQF